MTRALAAFIALAGLGVPAPGQEPPPFDIPAADKKPLTAGGYLEVRPALFGLDMGSPFSHLRFYNRDVNDPLFQWSSLVQWDARYEAGPSTLFVRSNTTLNHSYLGWSTGTRLFEANASFRPSESVTVDVGKKTMRWGKGYAWTPVAFLDRPKNPEDAELALEGLVVLAADYIRSLRGPLKTFAFTPVLVPVLRGVNEGFARNNTVSVAGKWYFLLHDTDIDVIALAGGGRSTRYGLDFSRNVKTNLEIHGEFAWIDDHVKRIVDASGNVAQRRTDARSWLLGLRYLTLDNVTFIVEYYHNGTGYTGSEMRSFMALVEHGYSQYASGGDDTALRAAGGLAEGGFGRMAAMKDYLFVRASQPDAFGTLYLTPALIWTHNLNDHSFALTQEMIYRPAANVELRSQLSFIHGGRRTEYGSKQNDLRAELRARMYF